MAAHLALPFGAPSSAALQPATSDTPGDLASSGVVWEHHPHTVDAVISDEHKIVYIDNVKAGSSTLRAWCGGASPPTVL